MMITFNNDYESIFYDEPHFAFFDNNLQGPDHMALMIWPVAGVELVGWSANPNLPHVDPFYAGTARPLYFVTYFYGVQPTAPYQLTVTLKVHSICCSYSHA